MYLLTQIFPKTLNEQLITMYDKALGDIPMEGLEKAVAYVIRDHTGGFPSPAIIRQAFTAHVYRPPSVPALPEPEVTEQDREWARLWCQWARKSIGNVHPVDPQVAFYRYAIEQKGLEWCRICVERNGGSLPKLRIAAYSQKGVD